MPGAVDNLEVLDPAQAGEPIEQDPPHEPYLILEQDVKLEFNFRDKSISGTTTLTVFHYNAEDAEMIVLDARQCEIDTKNITVDGKKVKATYKDPYELLDTPKGYNWTAQQHHIRTKRMAPLLQTKRAELPMTEREKGCMPVDKSLRIWLRPDKRNVPAPKPTNKIVIRRTNTSLSLPKQAPEKERSKDTSKLTFEITIPFRTNHVRDGFHFVGIEDGDNRYPHLYTRHSVESGAASCLFPCIDDRYRVRWKVALKFPRTVGDALKQPLATQANTIPLVNGDQHVAKNQQQPWDRHFAMTEQDKLLEMTAVCSGTLIGEHVDNDDETKKVMTFESTPCGAHHIGFAIGPFEDVDLYSSFRSEEDDEKLRGNAVKVHGYCMPGRADEVRNTCAALASAADHFALTFGKYPFDNYKLCFVEDMVEDTVPLQGFSLCSSRLLIPEGIIETEIEITRKLVHSLASQYFGIFMNANERTDNWIIVGLAYYMTDQFLKKLCGNNYYRFQMRTLSDYLVDADHKRPSIHDLGEHLHLGSFEMEFMAHKAPLVIFILDRRLLKASNTAGMTRVISFLLREAGQAVLREAGFDTSHAVSSDKFRKLCEKRGRGIRLESFWDQWVFGAGCPRLDVTQRFNKKRLEVELIVVQDQVKWANEPHALNKDTFWRDLMEERHGVYEGNVPLTFTGPMTFRVHEADGTPYEHCLEIKLDAIATKGSRLPMPYNTKYKRIKKARMKKKDNQKSKATAAARGDPDGNDDEDKDDDEDSGQTVNHFGDILNSIDDMDSWRLVDWDDDMQQQMDQESYEWIRVDCDFEWMYHLKSNLKVYMTVSQLQQDRDIAGQVEAMLTLSKNDPSNIQTTILLRTLYDDRYFTGIRQMAANALTKHADSRNNWRGMHHLIRVFKTFWCHPNSSSPLPNDFSKKSDFLVRSAIPGALARIRGGEDYCPKEARDFILDQLVFNKNDQNEYLDHFYIAKLLEALATSLVREPSKNGRRAAPDQDEDPEVAAERNSFIARALEQIDRYCRMDEWVGSFQNIWTVTAIDCKARLMKSGVIPVNPIEFLQYLTDDTLDLVQIKAFESLIDLGLFLKPALMRLLFTTLSTHNSPFVRDRLFKALCRGLAGIAFGESDAVDTTRLIETANEDADHGGLIVEHSDAVIRKNQDALARKQNINKAADALKEALKDNKDLQKEIWKAVDSPVFGLSEKRNLLDLCAILFEQDDEMLITLEYPKKWSVEKGLPRSGRSQSLVMNFKLIPKTKLSKRKRDDDIEEVREAAPGLVSLPVPVLVPGPDQQPPEPKRIKLAAPRASVSGMSVNGAAPPAPRPRQPSIAVAPPPALARGDSIAVQGVGAKALSGSVNPARATPVRATPVPTTTGPGHGPTPEPHINGFKSGPKLESKSGAKPASRPAKIKKRKIEDTETSTQSHRPRKIVTCTYDPSRLNPEQKEQWGKTPWPRASTGSSTIVATPVARTPSASSPGTVDASFGSSTVSASSQQTPGGAKAARKPLPTSAPQQSASPNGVSTAVTAKPRPPQVPSPAAFRSSTDPANKTPAPPPRPKIKLKVVKKLSSAMNGGPPTPHT